MDLGEKRWLPWVSVAIAAGLGFAFGPAQAAGVLGGLLVAAAATWTIRRVPGTPERKVEQGRGPESERKRSAQRAAGERRPIAGAERRRAGRTASEGPEAAPSVARDTPSLAQPIAFALLAHFALAVVVNVTDFATKVAPDHRGYAKFGQLTAEAWDDPSIDLTQATGYDPRSFYRQLNGLVWWLFDVDSAMVLSLVNGVVGTLAAWVFSLLAAEIYDRRTARITFFLAAFFPSLMLWSSTNLRDAWGWLLIAVFVHSSQVLRDRFRLGHLALLAGSLAGTWFLRPYMVMLLLGALGLSYIVVRFRRLPVTALGLTLYLSFVVLFGERIGLGRDLVSERAFEILQASREGLSVGGSALASVDVSTPAAALAHLPLGVAQFMLAPFPWAIESWRQAIALPETLFWYVLLFFAARAALRLLARAPWALALPLATVAMISIAYGLVEGNEGTAYRHRAQVMPICFVFVAAHWTRAGPRRRRA